MNLQKLRLGQLKPADGATTLGELNFHKVKLLLPLNGSNAATSTSDLSNDNRTITFSGSNANISTAQSKFGGSSLYIGGDGSKIEIGADGLDATGDFTFECWIYDTSVDNYPQLAINSSSNGFFLYLGNGATSGSSKVLRHWNGGSVTNFSTELPQSQWYHFALVRSGSTVKLYINGTADSTTRTDSGTYLMGQSSTLAIGADGAGNDFRGYINDLRITNGLARYTTNFTPPTSAHLTSSGDINKHIVVNSTVDGVAIGTGGINQARVAKAWCNFDGTGTPAIRGSYNCSSISDIGTGSYKVNFSTGMSDEGNYVAFCAGAEVNSGSSQNHLFHLKRETPTSDILNEDFVHVASANTSATQTDDGLFCVLVFGN
tara:strand:- start:39 stop:1160 length:1122 start_codon:yes stop_codon:yes gene_type:complete